MAKRKKQTVGEAIREARLAAGLTQVELAQRVGIPQSHVSRYERGERIPTLQSLVRIGEAMELSTVVTAADVRLVKSADLHLPPEGD